MTINSWLFYPKFGATQLLSIELQNLFQTTSVIFGFEMRARSERPTKQLEQDWHRRLT